MAEITEPKKITRSQSAFKSAKPEVQKLIKESLTLERQVQHMKNRQLRSSGQGIHEALLERVKSLTS
jgi:hypothetical protein